MIRTQLITVFAIASFFGGWLAAAAAAQAPADVKPDRQSKQLEAILEANAPAIVTIRVVFELDAQGRKQELRRDLLGTVVHASGLIMVANADINPKVPTNPRVGPIKVTPVDIKIVIGKASKEHDAFIAATDSKYGLAFLQMKDLGETKLTVITIAEKVELGLGQKLVALGRMSRGFDFAPFCSMARVAGRIKKPRKATITSGEILSGLPCFTLDGQVAGVHLPIASADAGDPSRSSAPLFLISPKIVGAKIKQSLKRAKTLLEDLKKEAEAAAKEKPATKPDAKPESTPASKPTKKKPEPKKPEPKKPETQEGSR